MAKFTITFQRIREDEEVDAERFIDHLPFVDFYRHESPGGENVVVARYRADDIQRIVREF